MNRIILLGVILSLITVSCTDPSEKIGLEVHPPSDNIIFSDTSSMHWQISETESEDSLKTDNTLALVVGEISDDQVFGHNQAGFYTQILLQENNTEIAENPIIDSVILSYTYLDYYGDLQEFSSINVQRIYQSIHKDSSYYSNSFDITNFGETNWAEEVKILENSNTLRIKLDNALGSSILNLGNETLKDNETFLQSFQGISVSAQAENTMLYLSPDGSNTSFKIYYHYNTSSLDSSLSLDFGLGGDAARFNIFNDKPLSSIVQSEGQRYIQSMGGCKMKITLNNTDSIRGLLLGKVLNKVTMSFSVAAGSQSEYVAHEKLVLVRVDQEGKNKFLLDFSSEGDAHFGGGLFTTEDGIDKYEFNITLYFDELLNNGSYTNELYLLAAGAAVNSNRTILNKDIILTIYHSEL